MFCYYAATVFFGPDKMADFLASNDGNPWGGMANQVLPGIGSLLVLFAILNSCLANANAGANASTRSIFSLGRSRLIPGASPRSIRPTGPRSTPSISRRSSGSSSPSGSACASATLPGHARPVEHLLRVGYAIGLSFAGCTWRSTSPRSATTGASSVAEFNWFKHLVVPIIGFIPMIPAFFGVLGGVTIPIIDLSSVARCAVLATSRRWSGSG